MSPTKDQARQFAIMLRAGLPAAEALLYFTEERDPGTLGAMLHSWTRSRAVRDATAELMTKAWQEMTLEEQCKAALDQHYASLAYFLFSHNYAEVSQVDKLKSDTARQAIEAKLAGTAGKTDALSQFFSDINSGKVKLSKPAPAFLGREVN